MHLAPIGVTGGMRIGFVFGHAEGKYADYAVIIGRRNQPADAAFRVGAGARSAKMYLAPAAANAQVRRHQLHKDKRDGRILDLGIRLIAVTHDDYRRCAVS